MKLSIISTVVPFLAQLVAAVPTPTWDEGELVERARIVKRATITDIATTGFATQNGG
jgi:pectate lyase